MIAHEAIFDMSRELRAQGSMTAETEGLLRESAEVVTKMLPNVTFTARQLAGRWSERDLLESSTAAVTMKEIKAEMERIGPEIEQLLARQRQIATGLRDLLKG
ncbi:MAG TPA: hypothetical protein VGI17_14710 [Solirubrobacterales bacterium]